MAKISIQQAASALAKKGYRLLGPGPYDLKTKSASYRVVDPSGHTAVLTQEQVKELMSTPALKRARALSLAKRRLSLAATSDKTGPAKDATIRDIQAAMRSVDNAKETATKWSYFDPVELFDRAKQSLAAALAQANKVNDILRDPRTRSLATPGGYRPQGQKLQLFIDKITNAVGNLDIIWRSEKNPDAAQSVAQGRKITQQIERLLADLEGVASDLDSIYDTER